MSMLGTKNKPGSEAIRDKNLLHSEGAMGYKDTAALVPLIFDNAVMGDPLVFLRVKEFIV